MVAFTSALMFFGISRLRANLIYPTLVARVIFIIFVAVFGVNTVVQPGAEQPEENVKATKKGVKIKHKSTSMNEV